MNRIETAVTGTTVTPLDLAAPTTPVSTPIALVAVGLGAAALGWNVGYNLGGSLEDASSLPQAALESAATIDELLTVRRAAVAG